MNWRPISKDNPRGFIKISQLFQRKNLPKYTPKEPRNKQQHKIKPVAG
jgi:hypothetical protein